MSQIYSSRVFLSEKVCNENIQINNLLEIDIRCNLQLPVQLARSS